MSDDQRTHNGQESHFYSIPSLISVIMFKNTCNIPLCRPKMYNDPTIVGRPTVYYAPQLITWLLWQVEKWFSRLYPCFRVPGIQWIHLWSSRTFTFDHIQRKCQFMFKLTTSFPENYIFGHNSAPLIDRDFILVSLPRCLGPPNTMSISLKL